MIDGHAQRKALTAAEQAIRALGEGKSDRANAAAARAVEMDQVGAFAGLVEAVAKGDWDAVREVVGPGPLSFVIDEVTGGS